MNATTTATAPIAKLYKRCAWGTHKSCAGDFANANGAIYSVCSCECHAPVKAAKAVKAPRKAKSLASRIRDRVHAEEMPKPAAKLNPIPAPADDRIKAIAGILERIQSTFDAADLNAAAAYLAQK